MKISNLCFCMAVVCLMLVLISNTTFFIVGFLFLEICFVVLSIGLDIQETKLNNTKDKENAN